MRKLPIWTTLVLLLASVATTINAQGNLQYGQVLLGTLSPATPSVTYNFNGTANDLVTIEAIAISPTLDTTLTVLAPSGAPIANNDNSLGRPTERDAGVTLLLPETGQYLVIVGRTNTGAEVGDFMVRLNGSPANPAPLSSTPVEGILSPDAPPQVFTVMGGNVSVTAAPGSIFAAQVVAPDGTLVASVAGSAIITLPDPTASYRLVLSATGSAPVNVSAVADGSPPDTTSSQSAGPATQPTTTSGACVAVIGTNGLNVRTGPSTDYAVITTLASGSLAVQGEYGGWYEVELANGVRGWAAASVVTTEGDCSTVPAAVPPAAPPPTNAGPTATPTATATSSATATSPTPGEDPPSGDGPTATPTATEALISPEATAELDGETQSIIAPAVMADDSGGDPQTLRITRGATSAVSGAVSAGGGDRIDRVSYNAPVGANVRLQITCSQSANIRFSITRNDNQSVAYNCGQTYEYTANVAASASGNIQIEALSGGTNLQWTISGTGF